MKRIFLDWDKPLLPTAVDKFVELYSALDFRDVVVVVSAKSSGLRLLELLAEYAETQNIAWYPPEMITFGALPEKFYEQTKPIADESTRIFAWVKALQNMPQELRELLPPVPVETYRQRILGEMFARLHYELTADDLDFIKVAQKCEELKLGIESRRWKLFADLQNEYHAILDSIEVWDRFSAVRYAIEQQSKAESERILKQNENKHFFLLGVTDMNKLHKDIIKKYQQFFTAIIFAPDREFFHKKFDEFGCLNSEKWEKEPIQIAKEQIVVTLDDAEQADEVMRTLSYWNTTKQVQSANDVIVGVPDTKIIPLLEERFERAGQNTRYVKGQPLQQTEVFRFIEVLADLIAESKETLQYRYYAELLRHPNVNHYLKSKLDQDEYVGRFLEQLDEYYNDHLPESVNETWLKNILISPDDTYRQGKNDESIFQLKIVWDKVQKLLTLNPNKTNAGNLNFLLQELFSDHTSPVFEKALKIIGNEADSLSKIPSELLKEISFADFLRLLLAQLSNEFIPPFESNGVIEFVGWLDIPLSDTTNVIITGMSDGVVPSYVNSDMFLPDKLRRALNITDNTRRIARDVYNLTVILKTRKPENVKFIASKTNPPSRLFFADKDDLEICRRADEFFEEKSKIVKRPPIRFIGDKTVKDKHQFVVPSTETLQKPITEISVTAFKKYKECPYRFYLGNVLYLKHINDDSIEIEANSFGRLIHKVLEIFGESDIRDTQDSKLIENFVLEKFDTFLQFQYGDIKNRNVAVDIQFEMAKRRLKNFAKHQVELRNQGWKIFKTELIFDKKTKNPNAMEVEIIEGMLLKGRIDRIDYNDDTKQYAVFDYKSADTAVKPEKSHWGGTTFNVKRGWLDFQLPLYHYLIQKSGQFQNGGIQLGYFNLPKDDKGGVRFVPEGFDVGSAIAECQDIAKKIQEQIFQPMQPPPRYDDFSEICLIPPVKTRK